jgi:hypothetical protein
MTDYTKRIADISSKCVERCGSGIFTETVVCRIKIRRLRSVITSLCGDHSGFRYLGDVEDDLTVLKIG